MKSGGSVRRKKNRWSLAPGTNLSTSKLPSSSSDALSSVGSPSGHKGVKPSKRIKKKKVKRIKKQKGKSGHTISHRKRKTSLLFANSRDDAAHQPSSPSKSGKDGGDDSKASAPKRRPYHQMVADDGPQFSRGKTTTADREFWEDVRPVLRRNMIYKTKKKRRSMMVSSNHPLKVSSEAPSKDVVDHWKRESAGDGVPVRGGRGGEETNPCSNPSTSSSSSKNVGCEERGNVSLLASQSSISAYLMGTSSLGPSPRRIGESQRNVMAYLDGVTSDHDSPRGPPPLNGGGGGGGGGGGKSNGHSNLLPRGDGGGGDDEFFTSTIEINDLVKRLLISQQSSSSSSSIGATDDDVADTRPSSTPGDCDESHALLHHISSELSNLEEALVETRRAVRRTPPCAAAAATTATHESDAGKFGGRRGKLDEVQARELLARRDRRGGARAADEDGCASTPKLVHMGHCESGDLSSSTTKSSSPSTTPPPTDGAGDHVETLRRLVHEAEARKRAAWQAYVDCESALAQARQRYEQALTTRTLAVPSISMPLIVSHEFDEDDDAFWD